MEILTIGHSSRNLQDFVGILIDNNIDVLIDVRRFPSSKKFPQYMKEALKDKLNRIGIEYYHLIHLGGFRPEGYKKFSKSPEFDEALKILLKTIDHKRGAIMCSEKDFWRCHRRYIAQRLTQMGHKVVHIMDAKNTLVHDLKSKDIENKMSLKMFCDRDDIEDIETT